jgi:dipeptidyl aminopeptidase/acylaminoacyl peptidase
MQAKLKAVGVSCDLITIDDGTHGMARWEEIDKTYKDKVTNWIKAKLGSGNNGRASL